MRLEKAQNDPWGWVHAIKLCKEKESTDSLFGRVVSKQYWHIQVYFRNRFLTTICQWLGNHILQQGSYGDLLSVHEWTFFSSSILMILLDWTCQLVFTMWIHTLWFNCGKKQYYVNQLPSWKTNGWRHQIADGLLDQENNNNILWRTVLWPTFVKLIYYLFFFCKKTK